MIDVERERMTGVDCDSFPCDEDLGFGRGSQNQQTHTCCDRRNGIQMQAVLVVLGEIRCGGSERHGCNPLVEEKFGLLFSDSGSWNVGDAGHILMCGTG